MEFNFSRLQETAAELAQKAVQGVNYVARKGRETYDRLSLENELHKTQRQLGACYYNQARMGADHGAMIEECMAKIDDLLDRLGELDDTAGKAAENEEKGPCCTVCGAEHDSGALFCVRCGAKL